MLFFINYLIPTTCTEVYFLLDLIIHSIAIASINASMPALCLTFRIIMKSVDDHPAVSGITITCTISRTRDTSAYHILTLQILGCNISFNLCALYEKFCHIKPFSIHIWYFPENAFFSVSVI